MSASNIRLPADWEPHAGCLMAWAVHREWRAQAAAVERELIDIIATIADYERVTVLVPSDRIAEARQRMPVHNIELLQAPVDDIWMRDIAPTFAWCGSEPILIDWNFNGWGSTPDRRSRPGDRLAGFIADLTGHRMIPAPFVAEGGAIATNGEGVIVTTESCLLNENRNPAFGLTVHEHWNVIALAFSKLGGEKVIWLEGDPDERITSGHVDGYLIFTSPRSLLVESDTGFAIPPKRRCDIETLASETDRAGHPFSVTLVEPARAKHGPRGLFAARSYLNAYVANGAVITAKFGDDVHDAAAEEALRHAFPGRDIRMLRMDALASGGGGVRCLTQPMI